MKLPLRHLLIILLVGMFAGITWAEVRVAVVTSEGIAASAVTVNTLVASLVSGGIPRDTISIGSVSDWRILSQANQPRLFVTLGTQATAALAEAPSGAPVLAALVPRQSFERILRQSGRKASKQLTAIYLDQPLSRQVALIRAALPQAKRVGVLWGPESKANGPLLRSLAEINGLQLVEADFKPEAGGFPDLRPVLATSDVFLAMADPQVFNSGTIQNLLLTTFRANLPMVAFSPAYVRAGAWLSLHVTPEQVGLQLARLVGEVLQGRSLPEQPLESNDFEISVNEHVGRSLNLKANAAQLRLHLRWLEQLP
jgi:putative tryptophan/tyrosine transport system substrate-binding protein